MACVAVVSALAVALLSRRSDVELRRARADALHQLRNAIVVDDHGRVVLAPIAELRGVAATHAPDDSWRLSIGTRQLALRGGQPLVDASGHHIGTLLVLPSTVEEAEPEQRIDRWLVWIVLGVGALGVVLSMVIGRSVTRPLERLTGAVVRVTNGETNVRVDAPRERELSTLAHAFNGLLDSLEHQEQLRRMLVSDVAHELRSPLANLRYQLEAMQDGVLPTDATTLASSLEEVVRLGRLVEDLQDLALADAGALRVEMRVVDLHTEIASIVHAVTPRMHAAGITVTVDIESAAVRADAVRLGQICETCSTTR